MINTLGDKIKKLRKDKGYTLEQLGTLTNSSKSYIWELENKNPPRPSADKLSKIAEQLEVTIDYFLDMENKVSKEDAIDIQFYRKYQSMPPSTKEKLRRIASVWDDDEEQ